MILRRDERHNVLAVGDHEERDLGTVEPLLEDDTVPGIAERMVNHC